MLENASFLDGIPESARLVRAGGGMFEKSMPTGPFPTTRYFEYTRTRPDRQMIREEWILQTVLFPDKEEVQSDGRIRRWRCIPEFENRALRVILLEDGATIHNAFFDRDFTSAP